MQIVYAITSNGDDAYTAMTRVSVASLRLFHTTARVVLACDRLTGDSLQRIHSPLLNEIDELISCETPAGDACFRNRFVKTSLRSRIAGAFLYLDSDTLIRKDIAALFRTSEDLAGARNHSRSARAEQVFVEDTETLTTMGWQVREAYYINGGVLFYNDTPRAHLFGTQWHTFWCESSARTGRYRDQPALNAALNTTGASLELLADEYNAQIKATASAGRDARIVHFYSSVNAPAIYAFDVLVGQLLEGRRLSRRNIRALAYRKHLWRRDMWFDDLFERTIRHKSKLDDVDLLWLQGKRREFLRVRWDEHRRTASTSEVALTFLLAALGKGDLQLPPVVVHSDSN